MIPTDKLTIRSTTLESKANEKIAAAVILKTPAIVVASRIETSVELIFGPSKQILDATMLQIKAYLLQLGKFYFW
ncbi:hypothetical protein [Collimonas sp.]|jgi:hypothetical protein|uniref:hypothetical protein n=1 Tax=Collimonas sp. TaxID=1963772 RepID=UPI0037C0815B